MVKEKKELFMVVDGNSLMHRGFHAIPNLTTSKGELTNAVYGFASILLKALADLAPDYVAVAFDLPVPTFRDKLFEEYKAKRVAAPSELYNQISRVHQFVEALGIPMFAQAGYEADDLIGTLASRVDNAVDTVIVTGDLDALQLVGDHTRVYTTRKGMTDTVVYDEARVRERYGLSSMQFVDFKALKGDSSDNIPGVKGIGEKTASDLIQKFGSLDALYAAIEANTTEGKISPRILGILAAGKENAFLSKTLATIVRDVPFDFSLERCAFGAFDRTGVMQLLQELEFRSLVARIPNVTSSKKESTPAVQEEETEEAKASKFLAHKKALAIVVSPETKRVALAWSAESSVVIPLRSRLLKDLLQSTTVEKYGYDLKSALHALARAGITLRRASFDVMVAAYLLQPGSSPKDFATLAFNLTGTESASLAERAMCVWQCVEILRERLASERLTGIFTDIEMPLFPLLARMEANGIAVDLVHVAELSGRISGEMQSMEERVYQLAGERFNVNSPRQLKQILFEKLGLSHGRIRRGKTGLSTAASELAKLSSLHPIVEAILQYRELAKLASTYIEALLTKVDRTTGRLHTTFHQTVTATGRLSSSDPNLQNIPVRSPLGQEIRACFVASPGKVLLSLDYSQMELRVVAHISGDKTLQKIFIEGQDVHAATASEVFSVPSDNITPNMRRKAKAINFGIIYGLSAQGLSQDSGMAYEEAASFIERYFQVFAGVSQWIRRIVEETRSTGVVTNPLGRKRYLPEINDTRHAVRAAAERAAVNMPVQSMQADIIKIAMINLGREFDLASDPCKLVLQVHDELLFEVDKTKVPTFLPRFRDIMANAMSLTVPVIVEAKVGPNWRDMLPVGG